MPEMPDPVSECPILNRVYLESKKDSKWLGNVFIPALKNKKLTLIQIGTKLGLLDNTKMFRCSDMSSGTFEDLGEADWLAKYWFGKKGDRWWEAQRKAPSSWWHDRVRSGFLKAANKADSKGLPLRSYWVCIDDLELKATKAIVVALPKPVIRFSLETPPPERDCIAIP